MFLFPLPGEMIQIDQYFLIGLKPPTSLLFVLERVFQHNMATWACGWAILRVCRPNRVIRLLAQWVANFLKLVWTWCTLLGTNIISLYQGSFESMSFRTSRLVGYVNSLEGIENCITQIYWVTENVSGKTFRWKYFTKVKVVDGTTSWKYSFIIR